MIHRIYSSLESFKSVSFHSGLNILLADKTATSTQGQTRNSAGKTSLVEIVHFLTGANCGEGAIFSNPTLKDHSFGMDCDIGHLRISVERTGAKPGDIRLLYLAGDRSFWPDKYFREATEEVITNSQWRDLLGRLVFKLDNPSVDAVKSHRPSFRSLFSYFARRQSDKGFLDPSRQSENQAPWDQQVMLSYMLDLDWTIPREFEALKTRQASLKALRKAAGKEFRSAMGTTADLRNKLAEAQEIAARRRRDVAEFRILQGRQERQSELHNADARIRSLRNENQSDELLIRELEQALREESPPAQGDVGRVYEEAGLSLPGVVLRRFNEVEEFHRSVLANRQSYLTGELESARQRVRERQREMETVEQRRVGLLRLLHASGALEDFSALQIELAQSEADVYALTEKFSAAQQLENTEADLEVTRHQLVRRLQQDYTERSSQLREAIVTLGEIVGELYQDRPGRLLVEPTTKGPNIHIKIEGDRGTGISNMEIFAFDVTLMRLLSERDMGPGFLIHDSHLFDGVDTRQRATALMVGKRAAKATNWQYIVTMNSDELPDEADTPDGFRIDDSILPVRLTDDTESGGLFGVRFD